MTDIETAVNNLEGHSICLCRAGEFFTHDGRGISPLMEMIADGKELKGFSCADVIVGRAAAMLFSKVGAAAVYGRVMSAGAKAYLEAHGIETDYGELTDKIINRLGTDICPMEKAVADIEDYEEGYVALKAQLAKMRAANGK